MGEELEWLRYKFCCDAKSIITFKINSLQTRAIGHLILKLIGVQWKKPKLFIVFETVPCKTYSKSCSREQNDTVALKQFLPQRDALAPQTHDIGFDTICCI